MSVGECGRGGGVCRRWWLGPREVVRADLDGRMLAVSGCVGLRPDDAVVAVRCRLGHAARRANPVSVKAGGGADSVGF